MSLLDLFKREDRYKDEVANLQVDVLCGRCGKSMLGSLPSRSDFFYESLMKKGKFESAKWGFGIFLEDQSRDYTFAKIDSIYITANGSDLETEPFTGTVLTNGKPFDIVNADRETVAAVFGEPWWEDNTEDGSLWFFELPEFEIQVDIDRDNKLVDVLLVKDRCMADKEFRESFGVTKPLAF